MRALLAIGCLGLLASQPLGQEPPLDEKRLSIHTLVREDIFAGWRTDDMKRFARGEKNIDKLLKKRPQAKADLLAWKGGARLFRAVLAHEAGKTKQFEKLYKEALALFAEAKKVGPRSVGVLAVSGGSYAMFADRLPKKLQAAAWKDCYQSFNTLWSMQSTFIDKAPMHVSGELLAGLAQSSQRTGRKKEMNKYLDKILEVLPNSPYAKVAKRWKADPKVAATGRISCKSCHAPGRLKARLEGLKEK